MAGSTAAVPSLASLIFLLGKVLTQYESAVKAKSVNFYPSHLSIAPQDIAGPSKSASIAWTIRCVPALLDKERDKAAKEDQNSTSKENEKKVVQRNSSEDVFAPPYHPDLLVEELPEHTILLNKFCVVPRHFLLVTRDFQPQNLPPSPDTLAIAFRLLCAHQKLTSQHSPDVGVGKELLAFYNCGQASGASQPHQHMQFAELGGEEEVEASGGNRSAKHSVPVEVLLDRIVKDGKEEENTHALPLPYQHFVCLLSKAEPEDDRRLSQYLGSKLLSLLDALFQARLSAHASSSSNSTQQGRPASPCWNLLMTTRAMHLIPRQKEEFDGLKSIAKESRKVVDGVEVIGSLSINSLGYAGHMLVKSEEELIALKQYPGGMTEILRQTGTRPVDDITTSASL